MFTSKSFTVADKDYLAFDAWPLRPVHEWVGGFEKFWTETFDRLDEYVRDLNRARQEESPDDDDQ